MTGDTPRDVNFIMWGLIPVRYGNAEKCLPKAKRSLSHRHRFAPTADAISVRRQFASDADAEAEEDFAGPVWLYERERRTLDIRFGTVRERIDSGYFVEAQRILSLFSKLNGGAELSKRSLHILHSADMSLSSGTALEQRRLRNAYGSATKLFGTALPRREKALEEKFAPSLTHSGKSMPKRFSKIHRRTWRKAQSFILKNIFVSDGSFIRCCIDRLAGDGKLKMPTDEQRRSLAIVIETVV